MLRFFLSFINDKTIKKILSTINNFDLFSLLPLNIETEQLCVGP